MEQRDAGEEKGSKQDSQQRKHAAQAQADEAMALSFPTTRPVKKQRGEGGRAAADIAPEGTTGRRRQERGQRVGRRRAPMPWIAKRRVNQRTRTHGTSKGRRRQNGNKSSTHRATRTSKSGREGTSRKVLGTKRWRRRRLCRAGRVPRARTDARTRMQAVGATGDSAKKPKDAGGGCDRSEAFEAEKRTDQSRRARPTGDVGRRDAKGCAGLHTKEKVHDVAGCDA